MYKFQTDGGQIEMPKASRENEWGGGAAHPSPALGRGCPPLQPTRGLGERRKLPQRGPAARAETPQKMSFGVC